MAPTRVDSPTLLSLTLLVVLLTLTLIPGALAVRHKISSAAASAQLAARERASFRRNFELFDWCRSMGSCRERPDGGATLRLMHGSAAALRSRNLYHAGVFSIQMRLPRVSTGGMVPAFYLIDNITSSNSDPLHAEVDMEFLGAPNPRDITIHTNVFTGGKQNLWQFSFPFDPSDGFHTYTIIWSPLAITWMVDKVPVRVLIKSPNRPWPTTPMMMKVSIWEAGAWSGYTANYDNGPVEVQVRNLRITGCKATSMSGPVPPCAKSLARALPWNVRLPDRQKQLYKDFQRTHIKAAYGWGNA